MNGWAGIERKNYFLSMKVAHPMDSILDSRNDICSLNAMTHQELEEGEVLNLDFTKLRKVANCESDVLPAVAQDARTGEVLIVGYANDLALQTARKCGMATFWSTSRNELWIKGKTSGDYLKIEEIRVNCEQNSILYRVVPAGKGACHTKNPDGTARTGCYYRRLKDDGALEFVNPAQPRA
jgi:phosphoribosyl-AMP cyclohydrolase